MYGELDKLPPVLVGGVNTNLLLRISLEDVSRDKFIPPYQGPGVVVRVFRKDDAGEESATAVVDSIIPVRKEDVKNFDNETLDEAVARRTREVSTRISHYLEAYGVTREQIAGVGRADSFEDWCKKVLALLPEDYSDTPVEMILVYLSNGTLWTPRYLKGKGYGPFVSSKHGTLRVLNKHNVVPVQRADEPSGDAATPATPW